MTKLSEMRRDEDEVREFLYHRGVTVDMDHLWTREDLLVDALEAALDDKNEWIAYFLWERDGKLDGEPCVFERDNTPIDTSDWGKVYDLIAADIRGEDVGYV